MSNFDIVILKYFRDLFTVWIDSWTQAERRRVAEMFSGKKNREWW